jgi:hypothetical protein
MRDVITALVNLHVRDAPGVHQPNKPVNVPAGSRLEQQPGYIFLHMHTGKTLSENAQPP